MGEPTRTATQRLASWLSPGTFIIGFSHGIAWLFSGGVRAVGWLALSASDRPRSQAQIRRGVDWLADGGGDAIRGTGEAVGRGVNGAIRATLHAVGWVAEGVAIASEMSPESAAAGSATTDPEDEAADDASKGSD